MPTSELNMSEINDTTGLPTTDMLRKILFVDEPFADATGMRASRSRYIWELLYSNFDADLLLLKNSTYISHPVTAHIGYDKLYSLSLDGTSELYPESYHILAEGQAERFANILDSKRFELIVFAGLSCLPLLRIARKVLPRCRFVIDVDGYALPGLEARWKANKKLESVNNLWAYTKQYIWDKLLLKRDVRFFFHNPEDARKIMQAIKLSEEDCYLFQLPITITDGEPSLSGPDDRYILFGGLQPNDDNSEAARMLVSEIYPRISKKMIEKDIKLILCGSSLLADYCGGRILHFNTDMQMAEAEPKLGYTFQQLAENALLVLLPLSQTDAEDRITQCAAAGKALVCTQRAIEAWKIPEDCYLAGVNAEELAKHILRLLQHPKEANALARNLKQYYVDNFLEDGINKAVLEKLKAWIGDYDQ